MTPFGFAPFGVTFVLAIAWLALVDWVGLPFARRVKVDTLRR